MRKGAMDYASLILMEDARDNKTNQTDYVGQDEFWSQPNTMQFGDGGIRMEIMDAQGRFNLNNLVKRDNNPQVEKQRVLYERLLLNMGLESPVASSLVDSLVDW